MRVAFRSILDRVDRIALAAPRESLRFRQGTLRGLEKLPLVFG